MQRIQKKHHILKSCQPLILQTMNYYLKKQTQFVRPRSDLSGSTANYELYLKNKPNPGSDNNEPTKNEKTNPINQNKGGNLKKQTQFHTRCRACHPDRRYAKRSVAFRSGGNYLISIAKRFLIKMKNKPNFKSTNCFCKTNPISNNSKNLAKSTRNVNIDRKLDKNSKY